MVKRAGSRQHEDADETNPQRRNLHRGAESAQHDPQRGDTQQAEATQRSDKRLLHAKAVFVPALFARQHSPNFGQRSLKIDLLIHGQKPEENRKQRPCPKLAARDSASLHFRPQLARDHPAGPGRRHVKHDRHPPGNRRIGRCQATIGQSIRYPPRGWSCPPDLSREFGRYARSIAAQEPKRSVGLRSALSAVVFSGAADDIGHYCSGCATRVMSERCLRGDKGS